MLRRILILLPCAVLLSPAAAKTIRLKDGEAVTGQVIRVAPDYIQMEVSGQERTYYTDEIENNLFPRAGNPPVRTAPDRSRDEARRLFARLSPAVVAVQMWSDRTGSAYFCNGFVVRPDGLVATALHCASWFDEIRVRLQDGRTYPVESVAAFDRKKDLCVLRIAARGLPSIPLGQAAGMRLDHPLYTILLSTDGRCTPGSGRLLSLRSSYGKMAFRSDLPIHPGHSGGPVLDGKGRAIGLHSSMEMDAIHYRYFMPLDGAGRLIEKSKPLSLAAFRKAAAFDGLLDQGSQYLQRGSTETALRLFQAAVDERPDSVEALGRLGEALRLSNRTGDATAVYRRAYALDPDEAWISLGLATVYVSSKQYSTALQFAEKAAREVPDHPWVLRVLGECYYANRRYWEAKTALKRSVDLVPESCGAYPALSASCIMLGEIKEGREYFARARRMGCKIPEDAEKALEKSIDRMWWLGTP